MQTTYLPRLVMCRRQRFFYLQNTLMQPQPLLPNLVVEAVAQLRVGDETKMTMT